MANVIGRVQPIQGELTVTGEYEITAEETEAAALSTTDTTNSTDWTYNATTEDNGWHHRACRDRPVCARCLRQLSASRGV